MKRFIGTFFICLVLVYVFLFFGGWMLFDFGHHFFLAGAAVAFLLAVLGTVWYDHEKRLEDLQKQVRDLEERLRGPENENTSEDS